MLHVMFVSLARMQDDLQQLSLWSNLLRSLSVTTVEGSCAHMLSLLQNLHNK